MRFRAETGDDFADHSHRRQNHDVDGGMRVEPEQMLEQQRIAAKRRAEDSHMKQMLEGQKENGNGQHRSAEHHDDAGGVHGPQKQRHAEPSHPRRAHFVNGDDEIQPGENGRKSGDENADRDGGDLGIGIRAAIGGVERPTRIHAAGDCRYNVNIPPTM